MKAIFSFTALLIVLAVVAVTVRNELRATKALAPVAAAPVDSGAASDPQAASAPFDGSSSPTVAQFQRELDKTMQTAADRAASAGGDADAR